MARYTVDEYVAFAAQAVYELVRSEYAVTWAEAQAKIADRKWHSIPTKINPHHMTTARAQLLRRHIRVSAGVGRTGTPVPLLHPADDRGIKDAIRTASRRKRALASRLETWARSTTRHRSGLIGTAGERVAYRSLLEAESHGVRPVNRQHPTGEVARLFDEPVKGGSLDNAAWVDLRDEYGRSTGSILCPIEVKNIRHWIYPRSQELFQLLYKAAVISQQHPDLDVCPVLVTRERSYTTDQMSRDLGFRVFDVHKQFVLPVAEVPPTEVEEVQRELGFVDLTRSDGPDPTLASLFRGSLRTTARANAARWSTNGSQLLDLYDALRQSMPDTDREKAIGDLRDAARSCEDPLGGW